MSVLSQIENLQIMIKDIMQKKLFNRMSQVKVKIFCDKMSQKRETIDKHGLNLVKIEFYDSKCELNIEKRTKDLINFA